jgi:putative endopeptidase
MSSGIDQAALDSSVRPQDDFFAAINGQWLRDFQIPEDKAQYASFTALHDAAEEQLHDIVTELVSKADLSVAANSDSQSPAAQVSILYSDFMDTERLNEIGVAALDPVLRRIAEITSVDQLPSVFGEFDRWGLRAPVGVFVHQDNKDATQYICDIRQSGLGLPDRDFYLDEKFTEILQQYRAHIARMWVLAGWGEETEALDVAGRIVEVETALATAHWDKVRNRDPEATYNRLTLQELVQLAPGFDARSFLAGAKIPADLASVNVGQPDYLNSLEQILQDTPLLAWREYLQWSTLAAMASLLDGTLDAANFDFFGTTLSGVPAQRARWKRAVGLAESAVGEALGQIYVERYFPPENKARMVELVDNLIAAYSEAIDDLEWMTGETKEQAHNKLATFRPKIGYPDTWRDYSGLRLVPGDVVGNVIAANVFEHDREIAKVGGPVDRDEWFMSPQTVNAYYNPEMNEIVFPAAILQPPFFNMEADDAVNYGGIGAVIGHEISHGFDDKGSQYDGQGNLRNWWTEQDSTAFEERTKALTDQYSAYEPIDGHQINGELTLGENIADVSGLAVSLRAYRRSLGVDDAAEIDGLTGEQRFFAESRKKFAD